MEHKEWMRPEDIERRSMEIIEQEMPAGNWTLGERAVVKRCIHTSADFDYASNLYFSPGAVERAIEILRTGAGIVTDTNMAAAGINKKVLGRLGGTIHCFMAAEDVAEEATRRGITRAVVSMERAAKRRACAFIGDCGSGGICQCGRVQGAYLHGGSALHHREREKRREQYCGSYL